MARDREKKRCCEFRFCQVMEALIHLNGEGPRIVPIGPKPTTPKRRVVPLPPLAILLVPCGCNHALQIEGSEADHDMVCKEPGVN